MLLAVEKAAGGFLADAQGDVFAVVRDRTATIRDVVDTVSIDEEPLASPVIIFSKRLPATPLLKEERHTGRCALITH
jgi:hypothetical protein